MAERKEVIPNMRLSAGHVGAFPPDEGSVYDFV